MMPDIRSKSYSLPHIQQYNELSSISLNQLKLDKKTKQSVHYICHICLLKRKEVDLNNELNDENAECFIENHLKKRLAHCNLYCLQDQLRFERSKQCGSNPPRRFILYKHIKFIYLSKNKPYSFILCTQFDNAKCKIYEIYKCKLSQDAKMLYVLIQKAIKDKEFLLRDELPYPKTSIGIQCCLIQSTSMHTADTISTYDNNTYYKKEKSISNIRQQSVLPVSKPLARANHLGITSNIYEEHSNELIQKQDVTTASSSKYTNRSLELLKKLNNAYNIDAELHDNTWHVSMILLKTDYIKGPRINDSGPIYMFVARQLK
ncbi:hypothetical protein EWB00_005447 [Schistosoma japonicum]|uniref:Trematode PH-like domain-containing protein n=1 Tax=Schistosoma japonicum TaxID=6182 RepID=A0A4Z2DU49_SCHJA|nr:hypothetical protein EWB00_005447 [Schistosoma japonicum]